MSIKEEKFSFNQNDIKNGFANNYGVLLLNMGGPNSRKDVLGYLNRLFSDPYILQMPFFLRKPLAFLISRLRAKKAIARYNLIGGKSPLGEETTKQAKELEKLLQFPVTYAMRYTSPRVVNALEELQRKNVKQLVLLPLYPQFSISTTKSGLEDFFQNNHLGFPIKVIEKFFDHPSFIDSISFLLNNCLNKIEDQSKSAVIFIAHSIPLKQVNKGDPYVEQVEKTVSLLVDKSGLKIPYYLTYQSQVGPVKWQGPTIEDTMQLLKKDGIQQVIVQPLSFVSENLETLYDLDIQFKNLCLDLGIKKFHRIPTPGTSPLFIQALADLVKEAINQRGGGAPNLKGRFNEGLPLD